MDNNKKIIKQVAAILIAGLLAWLSFRGADLSQVMLDMRSANTAYLGLLCLSIILSHLLRAWRWLILLIPVADKKISLWHSFCAIIYGYLVNIIVPRGGEIARLVTICKTERLPWAGVLPTLLIDRLLDLVALALLLGFTLLSLPPAQIRLLPWLYPCGISLTVATVALFLALPILPSIITFLINLPWLKRFIPNLVMNKIKTLLEEFAIGARSLNNPNTYPLIAFFTFGIWFFYWLNYHLVLLAFSLDQKLTLSKELIGFTIASVGPLVPTPGCVGGFHLLVSQALVIIAGIDQNLALAFATVLHAFAFVIVIAACALFCFVCENWRNLSGKKDKSVTSDQLS